MFKLIDLPYGINDLAPVVSAETLEYHHGKHLATYINNLNNLLPGSGFEDKSLEEIVKNASRSRRNSTLPLPHSLALAGHG